MRTFAPHFRSPLASLPMRVLYSWVMVMRVLALTVKAPEEGTRDPSNEIYICS